MIFDASYMWFFCDFVIFVCDLFVISRKVYEKKISDLPLGDNRSISRKAWQYQRIK